MQMSLALKMVAFVVWRGNEVVESRPKRRDEIGSAIDAGKHNTSILCLTFCQQLTP